MSTLTDRGLHTGPLSPRRDATSVDRPVEIEVEADGAAPLALRGEGQDRRRHRRFAVAPMYGAIRIRTAEDEVMDGHLRDISISGAGFESSRSFELDERVRFEIELPARAATLRGFGRVVRIEREHEVLDDAIVAIEFERFETRIDAGTLTRYLEQGSLLRAA